MKCDEYNVMYTAEIICGLSRVDGASSQRQAIDGSGTTISFPVPPTLIPGLPDGKSAPCVPEQTQLGRDVSICQTDSATSTKLHLSHELATNRTRPESLDRCTIAVAFLAFHGRHAETRRVKSQTLHPSAVGHPSPLQSPFSRQPMLPPRRETVPDIAAGLRGCMDTLTSPHSWSLVWPRPQHMYGPSTGRFGDGRPRRPRTVRGGGG